MPSYRDRRGRFTTRSIWESLFQQAEPPAPEEVRRVAPIINDVSYGQVWSSQEYYNNQPSGEVIPLDPAELRRMDPGWRQYKVVFRVPDNPDYPRGYGMSDPIIGEWPPDISMGAGMGATEIIAIHFYD